MILGIAAERKRDPVELATVARQAAMVGEKLFAPAGIVVVAMGVAMMVNTELGLGQVLGHRRARRLRDHVRDRRRRALAAGRRRSPRSIEEKGANDPETAAAITRVLQIVRIDVAMLLLVVVDMVVKPFS